MWAALKDATPQRRGKFGVLGAASAEINDQGIMVEWLEYRRCRMCLSKGLEDRQADRLVWGAAGFRGEYSECVFPELFGGFEVLVVDTFVVKFAFVGRVGTADSGAGFVNSAAEVRLDVLAVAGHHQVPGFAVDEDGEGAVEQVPANVVELLASFGAIDLHGEVAAAAGRAVAAEDFPWGKCFAGDARSVHGMVLERLGKTRIVVRFGFGSTLRSLSRAEMAGFLG